MFVIDHKLGPPHFPFARLHTAWQTLWGTWLDWVACYVISFIQIRRQSDSSSGDLVLVTPDLVLVTPAVSLVTPGWLEAGVSAAILNTRNADMTSSAQALGTVKLNTHQPRPNWEVLHTAFLNTRMDQYEPCNRARFLTEFVTQCRA